ncbi:unnamed protein product [Eruca vesicaria subsp. sativa]|uniref:Uncharacterized protein n=1 Tax=Eruca vesicaria subsp. sativa TaxID=29727 RepID=A0ABC8L6Q7_ERUVS|nr:unnamed protein product [Eruca vesicaria subsp. sativa]
MPTSYTVLADLKAGRCSKAAEICFLRFWEARNLTKNGQLMSLEMLLIDEHLTFRGRLAKGLVYTLSGFDVARSSPKYRLSVGPVSIRFNEGTDLRKLATTSRIIPTEHFRFRPFQQIRELANNGKQLPDVMGELLAIKSTITDRLHGAPRVMLTIRLERSLCEYV